MKREKTLLCPQTLSKEFFFSLLMKDNILQRRESFLFLILSSWTPKNGRKPQNTCLRTWINVWNWLWARIFLHRLVLLIFNSNQFSKFKMQHFSSQQFNLLRFAQWRLGKSFQTQIWMHRQWQTLSSSSASKWNFDLKVLSSVRACFFVERACWSSLCLRFSQQHRRRRWNLKTFQLWICVWNLGESV